MKNTVQKSLILQAVRSMTNHPTADEIYERVLALCPSISKGTVYRDLNVLARSGEILRIEVANAPDRFDFTTERHTHGMCTICGGVFDYKLETEPKLGVSDGFYANDYTVFVNGICKNCFDAKK